MPTPAGTCTAVRAPITSIVDCAASEEKNGGKGGNGGRKLNSQSISALTNPMPAATVSLKKLVRPWPKLMVPPTQ